MHVGRKYQTITWIVISRFAERTDVCARGEGEVDLAVPALTMMCGLPCNTVEDLIAFRQRLLQTVEDIKLATASGIVPKGIQSRGYLRHRGGIAAWAPRRRPTAA